MRWTEEQVQAIQRRQANPGAAPPAAKKRSKYGNKKTISGDKVFASGHEARRYAELELLQRDGQIRNLQRQVPFDMVVNGQHICTWIADAVYERVRLHYPGSSQKQWEIVAEDSKSVITRKRAEYSIKRKLMAACHGITIQEIL